MKQLIQTLCCLFLVANLAAQKNFQLSAKSGDTELDASLDEINVKAKLDVPFFKNDMKVEFGVSDQKLDDMLISLNMSPADVYMTLEMAKSTKKSEDEVLKVYNINKTKGWGAIAKEMGIKPGSPEFHALKGKAKNKKEKGPKNAGNKNAGNKGAGDAEKGNSGKGKRKK